MSPWKLTAEKLSWEFDSGDEDRWRLSVWAPRSLLSSAPGPGFLTRGGVLFEFIISVLPTDAPQSASSAQPIVPPSDKKDNLARVYQTKEGADVIYSVKGELFPAHKIILAMGSPVFKAELYGNMMESTAKVIQVKDMEPDVFEALLNYIYTDSLPTGNEDQDDKDVSSIICGLLVAGDRYGVDRLKLLCELELCTMLDVDNVAKMLEFANDQQCNVLKDACTAFIVNSDQMDKIKKSEGYTRLSESRPSILVEVLERAYQFRKVS
ncbi:hypothetical protein PR202_ga27673 [Eleusine coracana subsp. coracana]|uniref:BTB domain-containing protein n=1 Tax=Eleusine coracana subsp. coracana TaxID=191504 RepID=A0AAV5DGK5_ELECO|nr:hypothetical protein PR202_ga27673 [Eleusine coracana subsp. coracana]